MEQTKVKTFNIYKFFGLLADIITYPIVILSLLSVVSMFLSNQRGEVPSIFGYSVVSVLTPSMSSAGYEPGDLVLIGRTNTDDLRPGDIIAFYFHSDSGATHESLTLITDFDNFVEPTGEKVSGDSTMQDAITAKSNVYFHRIVSVYYLSDGTRYFKTKGDSNSQPDIVLIKEDFVVGKNIEIPAFINQFIDFASSSRGMIIMVVIPLSFLVLFECFSIIEQINNWLLDDKVFYREEPFDSKDSIRANIGRDMEIPRKVYFYATSKLEERERVKEFLWKTKPYETMKKEEYNEYARAKIALEMFETSPSKYWGYWIESAQSKRERKDLLKLFNQFEYETAIKQAAQLQEEDK